MPPLLLLVLVVLTHMILVLQQMIGEEYFGAIFLGSLVAFVVWVVWAKVLQNSTIRAAEITDSGITLQKVHARFVRAVRHDRGETEVRRVPELAWDDYDPYPRARELGD